MEGRQGHRAASQAHQVSPHPKSIAVEILRPRQNAAERGVMDLAALHECGLAKETADRAQCLGALDRPQARPLAIAPPINKNADTSLLALDAHWT